MIESAITVAVVFLVLTSTVVGACCITGPGFTNVKKDPKDPRRNPDVYDPHDPGENPPD